MLSLHVRLTRDATGIVGADDLARMKPTALIVNTSRAEVIAPGALLDALRKGRPGYAAVDVYEQEPIVNCNHSFLLLPNACARPISAGGMQVSSSISARPSSRSWRSSKASRCG